MPLTALEQELVDEIGGREGELVALAAELIRRDTTAREPGDPPREEAEVQGLLAARLAAAGFEVDVFEPDAAALAGRPLVPPGLDFVGRPQLAARLAGAGGGRSLLLNGHIDVVPADVADGWSSPPFAPEVRDGLLYGRGSCDMKGGIAAMVVAAEALARRGCVAGDLLVATNTDEESSGAGGVALVEHGVRADGGIVTEPTSFDVWISCRGSTYAHDHRPGSCRPRGDRSSPLAPRRRSERDREGTGRARRAARRARALGRRSGASAPAPEPAGCRADRDRGGRLGGHDPGRGTDHDGRHVPPGAGRRRRVGRRRGARGLGGDRCGLRCRRLARASIRRRSRGGRTAVMPLEIDPELPIVTTTCEAVAALGGTPRLSGLDSWYDGATFTLLAGTPAVGFGPSGLGRDGASPGARG